MDPSSQLHPQLPNGEGHQHIRLACQACQRKKIKCDRTFPCGQCQRSGLQCLPSTRKPRIRHVGSTKKAMDSELRSRISKLESLVESLSGDPGETSAQDEAPLEVDALSGPSSNQESSLPQSKKYIASPFFQTLANEVQSLRDVLEEDTSDEELTEESPPSGTDLMSSANHDLLISGPSSIFVMPGALPDPTHEMAQQLYEIFLHNVDPVFKVLHRPTVQRFVHHNDSYLGHSAQSTPARALKAVMWFAAVTTLTDQDCVARFPGTTRQELLQLYRRHVDVALAQANVIITRDLPTVQAFVLYTAASRITDQSRRPWTFTGLIVRIAFSLGLNKEIPSDTPFMKETKRRLWHQMRVLDAFAAVDRGTSLLINLDCFDTPLPSNVNDVEYDENSTSIPHREEGLSDATFNLMAHSSSSLTMRLLMPETISTKGETWQQRLDLALDLGKRLRERYLQYCDLSIPFHRFLYAVGNSMAASSILRAVRPVNKHVSSIPPRVDSVFVLQLAVNSLREHEATHKDPEAQGWRWIFWVQWHALAVALAGLCSIRDTELANTAWELVEKSYERHARHVADARGGMLWRPIEKLYRSASAFRDRGTTYKAIIPDANMAKLDISNPPTATSATSVSLFGGQAILSRNSSNPYFGFQPSDNGFDLGFAGISPLQGDMTWMDFERIMEDISSTNAQATGGQDAAFADTNVPSSCMYGDWPSLLNQNQM